MIELKKLPKIYHKLKIIESEYYKGIPRFDFEKIPNELKIDKDSTGLVLYADNNEIKVGKIKRIIFNTKNEYIEVIEEKGLDYRPLLFLSTQVLLLDKTTRLYKQKLKRF